MITSVISWAYVSDGLNCLTAYTTIRVITVASVRSYWQQMIFTGKNVPPLELDTESLAIAYVGPETSTGKAK